jgi:hypothetical protein
LGSFVAKVHATLNCPQLSRIGITRKLSLGRQWRYCPAMSSAADLLGVRLPVELTRPSFGFAYFQSPL